MKVFFNNHGLLCDIDTYYCRILGELMNGVRGLVPSNFLDPVVDDPELTNLNLHEKHIK